jgi:hypothetical protein
MDTLLLQTQGHEILAEGEIDRRDCRLANACACDKQDRPRRNNCGGRAAYSVVSDRSTGNYNTVFGYVGAGYPRNFTIVISSV